MPKGYKIDLSDYWYKSQEEATKKDEKGNLVLDLDDNNEPKLVQKQRMVSPKFHLPNMICNSNIGLQNGQPHPEFDLMELGAIATQIEKIENGSLTLDKEDYDHLNRRIKVIQRYAGYRYYEMFRRIVEAEAVELGEKN